MIKEYSPDEMLDLWRLRRGLTPLRTDCTIVRTDGLDVDRMLRQQIADWYAGLLDTAPADLLPVADMADKVSVASVSDGVVTVRLPDLCRRVVAVRLEGWERDARIVTDLSSAEARMQESPYIRGGSVSPVALLSGRVLTLYSAPGDDVVIQTFRCVAEPADGNYVLDTRLIETIPLIPIEY